MNFPFVTDSLRGDVPINFYPVEDSVKGPILIGTPGLNELCDFTDSTIIRGLHAWGSYLYAVAVRGGESVLFRIASNGTYAEVGSGMAGITGPVWMEHNQDQLGICDPPDWWVYTPADNHFDKVTDADWEGGGAIAYQDGYGLYFIPNTNEWGFAGLNDFKNIDATDRYSKEGKPDNIISIFSDHREPWIFGTESIEVWYNAGGDNASAQTPTFARNAAGMLEFGCGAARSPVSWDNTVAWLSNHGLLLRANGYNAQVVSNDMISRAIRGYTTYADAISYSYIDDGHEFWVITFPTADETWVIDAKTKLLHKRTSWKTGGGYGRHRSNCYAYIWGKHYVGDYENGKVYEMALDIYDDEGSEIQRRVYSNEFHGGMRRLFFPSVQIEFEPGTGAVSQEPQAMLEYSNDGGQTWGPELWRDIGESGEYFRRAIWHRLGSAYRRIYRLTMTDAVEWKIYAIHGWDKI